MVSTLGIYVHIPFCRRKCHYCDFLSFSADEMVREQYVDSLVKEIQTGKDTFYSKYLSERKPVVDTVFIGGGTPSILTVSQTESILTALRDAYVIEDAAEITTECNPGTADAEKLHAYAEMGINRISFGMQSAVDEELAGLGRIHTFADVVTSVQMARKAGFGNINLDIMSAVPGQTMDSYRYTLEQAAALEPEHISAYSLIIEEGTPFYEKYKMIPPVDEDTDRNMYALTKEYLGKKGYERYEISNYAGDGLACRHNLKYWSGNDYIGVGLGASSKVADIRFRNESDFATYIRETGKGHTVSRIEEYLTREDKMSEFLILGLRKTAGISRAEFAASFSVDVMSVFGEQIQKFASEGLLLLQGDRICFSDRGLDVSNYVLCEFL